jgi:hypothetical protein
MAGFVPNWAAGVNTLNVRDFGADPTDTIDSTAAIQACFDAAFGSSGSPHGVANSTLNKAVYIPSGQYKLLGTLNLTQVHGGHIFGDSRESSILSLETGGSTDAVIRTDGCQYSKFENICFSIANNAIVGTCFDLDRSSGAVSVNIQSNTFTDCKFVNGKYGVLIDKTVASGSQGSENSFINCYFQGPPVANTSSGLKVVGQNALMNCVWGGNFAQNAIGIEVPAGGGSVPVIHGVSFQNQAAGYDIHILTSSPDDYSISGCRSETDNFAWLQAAPNAHISGCTQTGGANGVFLFGDGAVTVSGCHINGQFTGNMNLALVNNLMTSSNPLVNGTTGNFSGLITQWTGAAANPSGGVVQTLFKVADLPPVGVCKGLRLYVSDASAAASTTNFSSTVGAGKTITGGGANVIPVWCDGTDWRCG